MTSSATKITIVCERVILDKITAIIEAAGATGYTVIEGGGKGSHGVRTTDRPSVVKALAIVKIEIVVADRETAEKIAGAVNEKYFKHYSGIVYLERVEILRPQKF